MTILPNDQPDWVPVYTQDLSTLYAVRGGFQHLVDGSICGRTDEIPFDIPDGWRLDGMSIPKILMPLANLFPDGPHRMAVLFHDFGYAHLGAIPGLRIPLTRNQLDLILRAYCIAAGYSEARAQVVYEAVNQFGWIAWNRHAARSGNLSLALERSPSPLELLAMDGPVRQTVVV